MEVYGSGYSEDVHYLYSNNRTTETHRDAMVKQLTYLIQMYEVVLKIIDTHSSSVLN